MTCDKQSLNLKLFSVASLSKQTKALSTLSTIGCTKFSGILYPLAIPAKPDIATYKPIYSPPR